MKTMKVVPVKLRQYWRKLMDSTRHKMSFGAQCLDKIITRARGENWRRKNPKK